MRYLSALSSTKCGLVPNQVYLKRGERKQLIFWTDQNYDVPSESPENINKDEQVDLLLQLVNGAMPKPDQIFNTQEEEETYPQFQGVPTTTTISTTSTTVSTTTSTTTTSTTTSEEPTTTDREEEDASDSTTAVPTIPALDGQEDSLSTNEELVVTAQSDVVIDENVSDTVIEDFSTVSSNELLKETTTNSIVLVEDDVDTITPLTIAENEEVVEIVEPDASSQVMEGPTPSIIMAEIVTTTTTTSSTTTTTTTTTATTTTTTTATTTTNAFTSTTTSKELPSTTTSSTTDATTTSNPTTNKATTEETITTESFPNQSTSEVGTESSNTENDIVDDLYNEIFETGTTNQESIRTTQVPIEIVSDGFHITINNPIAHEPKTEPSMDSANEESTESIDKEITTTEKILSTSTKKDEGEDNSEDLNISITENAINTNAVTTQSANEVEDVQKTTIKSTSATTTVSTTTSLEEQIYEEILQEEKLEEEKNVKNDNNKTDEASTEQSTVDIQATEKSSLDVDEKPLDDDSSDGVSDNADIAVTARNIESSISSTQKIEIEMDTQTSTMKSGESTTLASIKDMQSQGKTSYVIVFCIV